MEKHDIFALVYVEQEFSENIFKGEGELVKITHVISKCCLLNRW